MDELNRKSITDFKQAEKKSIIIVLDNIRSMHNVGSVFRTADAFLIEAILICGYTPQPPHRDINKTALGATETVDWLFFENTCAAISELKNRGYSVLAVEQTENSITLENMKKITTKTAVVFGNEVEGVADEVLKLVDNYIEIPQLGMKHSLNISVAAGIVLWQLVWGK